MHTAIREALRKTEEEYWSFSLEQLFQRFVQQSCSKDVGCSATANEEEVQTRRKRTSGQLKAKEMRRHSLMAQRREEDARRKAASSSELEESEGTM